MVYKNGSFAADGDLGTSTINSNDGPFAIGAEGDGGMAFEGKIDDVRIYERALSEAEAQEIMDLGIPDPNCADLDDDGNVNLFDFTLLAENWHEEGNPLVINEFMASNSSGSDINDLQGDHDDWLEIYNTGSIPVDIGGMYLSDNLSNPIKCQIPDDSPNDTTIGPYGHLLIWADEDSEDGPLHVEFKLSGDGDEIGLFDTDGNTLVDSIVFGDQVTDISYGRYPDSGYAWRFMGFPTPEAQNNAGYLGRVVDTEFSHDRGFYVEDFNVTITCDTPDVTIRYTMNGSTPSGGQGSEYFIVIPIETTTCLRAAAFKPGWLPSNIDTQPYIFLEPDVRDFSSNLPIAVIDTFGEGIGQTTQTLTFAGFIDTTTGGRARITDSPDFIGRAGINIRGKSSVSFPKKQYHLETWGEYDQDKDVSILGFPAESDWVLQGPYSDKSLMRNVLSYQWSNDVGRYAVRTRFIEMFLNTDGGEILLSDYVGVYVLMEKIKRNKNRVDIAKLDSIDNTEPDVTGGYIIKKDKFDSGEPSFYTSTGQRLIYVEPNGFDITQAQKDWIKGYLDEFESVLYEPNFTDPNDGYTKYIDVDSFVDHHILVELTKNIDGFRLSTYMFKDRGGKLNMGPAWDYNLSLGNADYLDGWKSDGWYNSLLSNDQYPWWERLFEDPEFQLRYADRWFGLRRKLFATDWLLQTVDNTALLLDEAQARNFNFDCWDILGTYVWPNWFIAQTYQEEIDWMKGWLEQRLTWMDTQIGIEFAAVPPLFSQQGGQVPSGFDLTMGGSSGTIWYTTDGNDPRLPTGGSQGTSTTLVAEDDAKRVLIPTSDIGDTWRGSQPFNDSGWNDSIFIADKTGGVGYETTSGYEDYITYDVEAAMYNQNDTCYIRIPFTFNGNPDDFDFMTLRVRYDDGFVAYLNGVKISEHSDSLAVNFEDFSVTAYIDDLEQGDNILAIHSLNASTNRSDFLISVELVAGEGGSTGGVSDSAIEYIQPTPVTLTESTHIKARVLDGITWSALNEATFAVGPITDNLRITEMMYHPQDTGDPNNDPNAEFIELKNIGPETINLSLARFT
ncbi:MAG: CotH kinase family protein, partial [Planctomycetota bacterium]